MSFWKNEVLAEFHFNRYIFQMKTDLIIATATFHAFLLMIDYGEIGNVELSVPILALFKPSSLSLLYTSLEHKQPSLLNWFLIHIDIFLNLQSVYLFLQPSFLGVTRTSVLTVISFFHCTLRLENCVPANVYL